MSYRVSTQVYSGPFDLLLQLVNRQKVDIGAISISEVAEQYLAEAERIEALDLDVASDFLLVAATLLDIKAASLVPQEAPRKADDDDEFDIYIAPTEINKRVTLYPRDLYKSVKVKDEKLVIGESGDLELDFELEHYGYTLVKERYMGDLNFSARLRTGENLIGDSQIEVQY